jgi:hypothetical protein
MEASEYSPHEKPPAHIRDEFKRLQKMKPPELDKDQSILDLNTINFDDASLNTVGKIYKENIMNACLAFEREEADIIVKKDLLQNTSNCPIYEHPLHLGKLFAHLVRTFVKKSYLIII